jgi:hypothetical protein
MDVAATHFYAACRCSHLTLVKNTLILSSGRLRFQENQAAKTWGLLRALKMLSAALEREGKDVAWKMLLKGRGFC